MSPPSGAGTAAQAAVRLTWPEAFVITLAVGLTIFLNVRDTPFAAAAGIAAATMIVFVAMVAIPRGIDEITKNLRFLRQAADDLARLHEGQEGRR
ncbi:hypothetical protein [Amycolatopsis japonica]